MTWLDVLLIVFALSLVALSVERRWLGAIVSVCGVLLVGPLLRLGLGSPLLALALAVVVGFLLTLLARRMDARPRSGNDVGGAVAGGVAGLALAGTVLIAVAISLPLGRTPDGRVLYPAQELPAGVQAAANASALVGYGRSVLLQPLLAAQPNSDEYSQLEFTGWLHNWLVPGEPWLRN